MFAQYTGLLGTMFAISKSRAKDKLVEKRCRNQEASVRRLLNFCPHIASNCLNECGDDLVPTEGWGDRSQNCLHDMRIVGNT